MHMGWTEIGIGFQYRFLCEIGVENRHPFIRLNLTKYFHVRMSMIFVQKLA